MKKWQILTLIGGLLTLLALAALYVGDRAMWHGESVAIPHEEFGQLAATYYEGTQPAGILLLEGFGSNQNAMKTAVSEFTQEGIHVMTMDFSGHGRSPGTITFDNAATDELAKQTLAALEIFKQKSGLSPEQIILMGHSMGARVGLQAMTLSETPVAGLVLLGAQVNLVRNQQAETFTGTSDADLPWVQTLDGSTPAADILLISGSWDDILPPESADLLLAHLQRNEMTSTRDMVILDALVHNYEIHSPRVMELAKTWSGELWNLPLEAAAPTAQTRLILWAVALISLFLTLFAGWRWAGQRWPAPPLAFNITLQNKRRFLWSKLLLWLAAVPFALLLGGLIFLIPLGLLAFNIYYVCFIGGYGVLLLSLYGRGWMPGTNGRLPFIQTSQTAVSPVRTILAITIGLIVLVTTGLFVQSGLFFVPTGQRLIWLLIYTPFTALGFGIGLREFQLMAHNRVGKASLLATAVIGFIPFILYTLFLASLGSTSGMLGGLQGLIILALVWLSGGLIYQIGQHVWITAVIQAILLFWLVLPVGPLFAV